MEGLLKKGVRQATAMRDRGVIETGVRVWKGVLPDNTRMKLPDWQGAPGEEGMWNDVAGNV